MADVRIPDALRAAIDAETGGGIFRARAEALSDAYRASRPSSVSVNGTGDVAAYLTTRLPATYAAIARVLAEARGRAPDFSPKSLLDAGAGPGTASWAAAEAFPHLTQIVQIDESPHFLGTAGRLARHSAHPGLVGAQQLRATLSTASMSKANFDLIIAGYVLTELSDIAALHAATALWSTCNGLLVLIEPGRPRDYQRLMAVRAALIEAGGTVVAPCPHHRACPLPDGDWCHFSVRLPRRRLHRQAKGATLGYEDEKFSYLVVARPGIERQPVAARVIKPPPVSKFEIALPLCTAEGLEERRVPKRQPEAFKAARKLEWGDTID